MVKFESIDNSIFVGYKGTTNFFDKNLVVSSKYKNLQPYITVDNIEPDIGQYLVNINLTTDCNLYWNGTYIGASKIFLRNGQNSFIIDIQQNQILPFTVGIFAVNLSVGKSFSICNINIVKNSSIIPKINVPKFLSYNKSIRATQEKLLISKPIENPSVNQINKPVANLITKPINNPMSLPNVSNINTLLKTKKIIITSTQYPRYGGAATCAYEMHKYFLSNNICSACIFFDNTVKKNNQLLNPDNLPNVYGNNCVKFDCLDKINFCDIKQTVNKIYGAEPYLIFSFNYLAPILSKHIFGKSIVYYMVTGCNYICETNLIDSTAILINPIEVYKKESIEKTTIQISDYVVTNSQLTKNIFEKCYKRYFDDFVDLHEIFKIKGPNQENNDRFYDIVFICSNFSRKIKNIDLVKSIFENEKLANYKKICIGVNSEKFIGTNVRLNNVSKDFMSQNEIISILNNSKLILVPSYFESYSITSVEATQCGCIILATKNAACSATINKFFVMDSYDLSLWVNKIDNVLKNFIYFKQIFKNNYEKTLSIDYLWNTKPVNDNKGKINVVFASMDIPYVGGAATNLYRLIKSLDANEFNIYSIFVTNYGGNYNPDNLKNIFKIPFDNKIEQNLQNLKIMISAQIGHIDFIFCKNYKIVPFLKKIFGETKIIFSPSGLRYISHNSMDRYLMDMDIDKINHIDCCFGLDHINNLYAFVQTNDVYLDDYAVKQSDVVVPNSILTYDTIRKIYSDLPNLYYPINFTNIILENIPTDDFSLRKIDILFCSHDWKRPCKNRAMMVQIINDARLQNKKIIVIGKNNGTKTKDNITVYEYLDNDKLLELLKSVRIVVIPSKYDSNPNILVEAIANGCNIVTSQNVGNHENLDKKCIVDNYSNIDAWINTIIQCMDVRYKYNGYEKNQVLSDFKKLFRDTISHKKSVGIYKIPPDSDKNINNELSQPLFYFDYCEAPNNSFAYDIINYDIYFTLYVEISIMEKCTDMNYIIYDPDIEKNMFVYANKLYPSYLSEIKIWKIKDIKSFAHFNNANVYFVRGTYYSFFKKLIPNTSKIIFYPATSMKQLEQKCNKLVTDQKYYIVLNHENGCDGIYKSDKFVRFDKFALDKFVYYNSEREYHLCFAATEKQLTKNHHLFLHFVKYLETTKKHYKIIYIGDLNSILSANDMKNLLSSLSFVSIENKKSCTSEEMIDVYNKSKINILFSGRDAYPRVISESAACGCFNIALDTLSDGKPFYDGYMGALIGDSSVKKMLRQAGSLSYVPDEKLWKQIVVYMDTVFDHKNISIQSKNKYNVENVIKSIYG